MMTSASDPLPNSRAAAEIAPLPQVGLGCMLYEVDCQAQPREPTMPDAVPIGAVGRKRATATTIFTAAVLVSLAAIGSADAAPRGKPNQIKYEYGPPKDPVHQPIHDQMKEG